MRRKGFTLVELMVVVAIIAILAAVAVPMYTKFKQKSTASGPVKVCLGVTQALEAWFDEQGDFTSVGRLGDSSLQGTDSGTGNNVKVGANIPDLEQVTWTVTGAASQIVISWAFAGNKCPSAICNGAYCLSCNRSVGSCNLQIKFSSSDLGLDKNPGSSTCL